MNTSFPRVSKGGFTLIELLVAIAIISLLSSLVFASVRSAREKARYTKALQFSSHLDRALGASAIGMWDFEEGTGSVVTDISGFGNHGEIIGAAYTTDTYNDDTSRYGLDCSTGSVGGLDLTGATRDQTLSGWVKTSGTSPGPHQTVVGTDIGYPHGFWLMAYLYSYQVAVWIGDGSSASVVWSGVNVYDGNWHHLAAVYDYDDGEVSIYVDGEKKKTHSVGQVDISVRAGYGQICADYHSRGYGFNGSVDDVRVYAQSLSAQHIKEQYYAGLKRLYAKGEISREEYQTALLPSL